MRFGEKTCAKLGVTEMSEIITRKCAKCKGEIEIEKDNISSVLQFQDKYYHSDCFISMAEEKAASKRGKPQMWQDALDRVWELEAETKKMLEHYFARDELNAWLLENYDVVTVPNYFWQLVADLERGLYKRQKCKPVSVTMLCPMWRWGQKRLDKIAVNNRTNRKGPSNDSDRLRYDLAILLSHMNDYLKYTTRTKEETVEVAAKVENAKKFDYEKIYKQSKKEEKQDSILELMNDIF